MTSSNDRIYADIEPIRYEGPQSTNPLAFRWYDAKRVVLGKTLAEHLRPAACYWHSFCWGGQDPFALAGNLFERPWFQGEPLAAAQLKLDNAFDFFERLTIPYWCFHDRDVAPEGVGIFLITHDMPDVFGLSERLAVMKNGRMVGVYRTDQLTEDEVLGMIIGGKPVQRVQQCHQPIEST